MFKKTLLIAALSIGLMSTVQAADLSHTQSWGNSSSVQTVDTQVYGDISSTTVKYATDRADFAKPTAGCGSACSGTGDVDNDVVSASLSVSVKDTKVNEKTTGTVTTADSFCDTSISGGIIAATQGKRESQSWTYTSTQKHNVTEVKGYDVKVDTSTNGDYPGLGKGNDVKVVINGTNDFSTNAAEGFHVNTKDLSLKDISVKGFDGTSGTENGIGLSYTTTDLKVYDNSLTKDTGYSKSTTGYSSLK